MPPAEATATRAERSLHPTAAELSGWGDSRRSPASLLRPATTEELKAVVAALPAGGRGAIPRGMGRSYGDAAQRSGGWVLETTALKHFELDRTTGTVTAEAGVTIGELLDALVPARWTVPVVPGTQHVSVGGAIASDIHGKNHGTAGTFGSHVLSLALLTASGEVLELEPGDPVFAATLGGMGLTGIVLSARIKLRAVSGAWLSVDTDRVADLDAALATLSEAGGPHRVAWLDLLGPHRGRGIVTRAEEVGETVVAPEGGLPTVPARATVPAGFPTGLLRPETIRAFNELRFRTAPKRARGALEPLGAHMFPLDALNAWPRLYGPRGFVQYQLVVPPGREDVLQETIERLHRASVPCYLAVLKDFGPANDAPLSFPIRGWTLALDLPRAAPGLDRTLDGLDDLVAEAGGRVYLSKDSRMRPEALEAMYPGLEEWRETRERVDPEGMWQSDLSVRTGLVQHQPSTNGASAAAAPAALKRVLLIGGNSEIGLAIVRRLAADGPVRPYLLGRDRERLASSLASLAQAGCEPGTADVLEADDLDSHESVLSRAFEAAGGFDLVVLAIGVLGAQEGLDADTDEANEVMRVNFVDSGSLLIAAMRLLRAQGHGEIAVLSSVAAERARSANAIYGAAKAGFDALAQGLADAAADGGPRVLVVRPGFVTTKMTEGLDPAPFSTTAEAVAEATVKGLAGTAHTVWVPGALRYVFSVLRHVPRPIYRKLPL